MFTPQPATAAGHWRASRPHPGARSAPPHRLLTACPFPWGEGPFGGQGQRMACSGGLVLPNGFPSLPLTLPFTPYQRTRLDRPARWRPANRPCHLRLPAHTRPHHPDHPPAVACPRTAGHPRFPPSHPLPPSTTFAPVHKPCIHPTIVPFQFWCAHNPPALPRCPAAVM